MKTKQAKTHKVIAEQMEQMQQDVICILSPCTKNDKIVDAVCQTIIDGCRKIRATV